MTIDWKALEPHRPTGPRDNRYIIRLEKPSLQDRVAMSDMPVAVMGPAGSGKSSLLAQLTHLVLIGARRYLGVSVLMDHIHASAPSELASATHLETSTVHFWCLRGIAHHLAVLRGGETEVSALTALASQIVPNAIAKPREAIRPLARQLLAESKVDRLLLLVDGLERTPVDEIHPTLDALREFHDDLRMVAVLPATMLYGDQAAWISEQFRPHYVQAVDVLSEDPQLPLAARRWFFSEMLYRRIWTKDVPESIVEGAITASGGIPRTFLQLVQDAGSYALLAGRELPTLDDLAAAEQDQRQSLRRLLDQDDKRVLRESDGSDGSEIPMQRRARLIAHGLLLEYAHGGDLVVHPAPLLAPILGFRAA